MKAHRELVEKINNDHDEAHNKMKSEHFDTLN